MKASRSTGGDRRGLYLTGPALIAAGLGVNPWTLAWAMGRSEPAWRPTWQRVA